MTLTYDDEHLPKDGSLDHRHFQLFAKRLRNAGHKFRFFMCGEYGEQLLRPHYHACIFGYRPDDLVVYSERKASTEKLYTSNAIDKAWALGYTTVGELSLASASYVAGYCTKKITGKKALAHYAKLLPDGSEVNLKPEYGRASNRPGIGARFYDRYKSDFFPRDFALMDGRKLKVPDYYYRRLKKFDGHLAEQVEFERYRRSTYNEADQSPERLAVREKVALAREQHKAKRKYET